MGTCPKAHGHVLVNQMFQFNRILVLILMVMLLLLSCNNDQTARLHLKGQEEQKAQIESMVSNLEIDAQLGQLLIVYIRWKQNGKSITRLGEQERQFLRQLQPGGVVLYAENMVDPQQTLNLVAEIKELLTIPPFIAVDEEGGRVSRLQRSATMHASPIPSARRLGQSGPEAVSQAYTIIANELGALGINMNFAPVADLGGMTSSDIIGDRAFSDDIDQNAKMVAVAVAALKAQKIVPIVKHFPGHGRSAGDSHFGIQSVKVGLVELNKTDLKPFASAFEAGAAGIMTAHVSYPLLDPSNLPSSMSKIILKDLLRVQMGFGGLVITDALDMHGILGLTSAQEAAVASLQAGCDMLLGPARPLVVLKELQLALEDGRLSQSLVNDAVRRILTIKKEFGFFEKSEHPHTMENPSEILGSNQHLNLLKNVLKKKQN